MRLIFALLIGAIAIPLVLEGTPSPCDALERKLVQLASESEQDLVIGTLMQQFSGGGLAGALIKQEYPNLPAPLGCYLAYYRTWFG